MKNKNFWKGLLTLIFQGIAPVMFFKAPSAIQDAYGFILFFGVATTSTEPQREHRCGVRRRKNAAVSQEYFSLTC